MSAFVIATAHSASARSQASWREASPLPLARSEVAAAATRTQVFVIGGLTDDGMSSQRVDAYSPSLDRWTRAADLPIAVNHAMAAAAGGLIYVVGGYDATYRPLTTAFVLRHGRWLRLSSLPEGRAAGGVAIVKGRLYVVGGVAPAGLASRALVLDLTRKRWSVIPGPTPRQHLGVTALGGRIYAVAGRIAGFDSNLDTVESYAPASRRWQTLPPVPEPRGGTGAVSAAGLVVTVGGEAVGGTIASVYAYDPRARRWQRLPDLPTPRHGLAVASLGGRVFAIGGGPRPGLSSSDANEVLSLK